MDPFVHVPEQRLVVCSDPECRYAVLPSNINTHLKDEDTHNMPKKDRDRIIHEVQKIDGLIQHSNSSSPRSSTIMQKDIQLARRIRGAWGGLGSTLFKGVWEVGNKVTDCLEQAFLYRYSISGGAPRPSFSSPDSWVRSLRVGVRVDLISTGIRVTVPVVFIARIITYSEEAGECQLG
ncbi:hypothetical protein BKA61DRAFT_585163 [Leptodontidium sp. MPI-SDFR-AT-0119]|nr:hypothetical protein BKA61DRAFT_585163 [Leptodontidium sp. MPI-SDFR-AT-0119]